MGEGRGEDDDDDVIVSFLLEYWLVDALALTIDNLSSFTTVLAVTLATGPLLVVLTTFTPATTEFKAEDGESDSLPPPSESKLLGGLLDVEGTHVKRSSIGMELVDLFGGGDEEEDGLNCGASPLFTNLLAAVVTDNEDELLNVRVITWRYRGMCLECEHVQGCVCLCTVHLHTLM